MWVSFFIQPTAQVAGMGDPAPLKSTSPDFSVALVLIFLAERDNVYKRAASTLHEAPSGPSEIASMLDTDLLKLTMHCAIWEHFQNVSVVYEIHNRTRDKMFSRMAFKSLQAQVKGRYYV